MANTTADKLNYLQGTKDAIKQAIIAKGVAITPKDNFRSYAAKIGEITEGGGGGNPFEGVTDYSYLFINGRLLNLLPQAAENSKNVTNMSNMFKECTSLTTIPPLDTSNATNMVSMFDECGELTAVPALDISNITDMSKMFYYCKKLTALPQFDTSKITSLYYAFSDCETIPEVNLTDTSKVENFEGAFVFLRKAKKISKISLQKCKGNWVGPKFTLCGSLVHLEFDPEQTSFAADNLTVKLEDTAIKTDVEATITFNSLPNLTKMSANNHHTLKMPADNTISEEIKTIATNKGWVITQ